jgi:DNA replication and repair protein RecF
VRIACVRIERVSITGFRNIEREQLTLPAPGFSLVGRNGQGKTNLLEALYYLHLLRSFRGARDSEVAGFDAPGFHLGACVNGAPRSVREVSVGFDRQSRSKRVLLNGVQPQRLSDAYGAVPAVMCSPDDREIVAGPASLRRRYLDIVLATVSPRYLAALQQYRAALAQRNAALREAALRSDVGALAAWEPALATHGAVIVETRARWTADAASEFSRLCAAIGEHPAAELRYATNVLGENLRETLALRLAESRQLDVRRGATNVGPHRDDLRLSLGGREMRSYASAGQQRTAALALRMLEAATVRSALGGEPLLLLDDPFAELDRERAARILELLRVSSEGQLVLCVPREDDVPAELSALPRWQIEGGRIRA